MRHFIYLNNTPRRNENTTDSTLNTGNKGTISLIIDLSKVKKQEVESVKQDIKYVIDLTKKHKTKL